MVCPPTVLSAAHDDSTGPGPRDARTIRPLPPRTPYEDAIVGILSGVLGCEDVAVDDRLLALGDLSEVPRVVAQIRKTMEVDIPVADYVEAQTVAGLAATVAAKSLALRSATHPPVLIPRPHDASPVLSFDQQRLWMENQLLPGSIYNVHGRRRIRGELDVAVLEASIRVVITRHEALRTRFPPSDTAPIQVVDGPEGIGHLRLEDLSSGTAEEDTNRAARLLLDEELTAPFDLEHGPLIRCLLIRLAPREHILGVTMHHIVSDAWSIGLFVRELTALYRASADPALAGLPPIDVQYCDYAYWQRSWLTGDALEFRLSHWRDHLSGAPRALALPTVQRRTNALRAEAGQVCLELTESETTAMHGLCREHGVTSFMLLYAAFATLLARWSGQRDLVIGVPVAGRSSSSTERLIGFFVNLLPLRVDLADDPTFAALLERVRGSAVSAYARTDAPMDEVVRDLGVVRDPRRTPLFEVVLNVVASPEAEDVDGLVIEPMDTPSLFSRYDLTLTAQEAGGVLRFKLDFPADRCDVATGQELLRQLRTLLAVATEDPSSRLLDVSTGEPDATREPIPAPAPAPQLSVARHAADPSLTAVVDGEGPWTYRWLSSAADQIAAELVRRGIGSDETVGVVRRPSASLLACLTGAMQAGVVCTVIETDDPALTGPLGIATVLDPGPAGVPAVGTIDVRPLLPERDHSEPPSQAAAVDDDWAVKRLGLAPEDRVVVLTARPGHLVSAMCSGFGAGATLVIPDRGFGSDVGALAEWLRDHAVTVVYADVPILRALFTVPTLPSFPALRCVVVDNTGDLLPHDVEAVREMAPGCTFVGFYRVASDGRPSACHVVPTELAVRDAPLRIPLGVPLAGGVPIEVCRPSGLPAAVGELGAIWAGGERTGDSGRRWTDGTLEYACDTADEVIADHMQTVAALRDVPGIRDALVVSRADPAGGNDMVGYVAGPGLDAGSFVVQGQVASRLPDYLVPRQVFVLKTLPRTPWGEYDLRALPRPSGNAAAHGGHAAPRTPVERRLTAILEELLDVERVGIYDSFFELGGFSMLATRLITRMRDTFGVQLAVRAVFEAPSVDELARLVVTAQAERLDMDDLEALLREVEQV